MKKKIEVPSEIKVPIIKFSGKGAINIPATNPLATAEISDNHQINLGIFFPKRLLVLDNNIRTVRIIVKTCSFIL
jgi:hypothetical protein